MSTLEHFVGIFDNPQAQAMFFLITFGNPCHDAKTHYTNANTLSFYQKALLQDIHNHTNWESFINVTPEDFHAGKAMFLDLAQAICCCMSLEFTWKNEMLCSILDEMFQIPTLWLRENIAAFLLFCSEKVCQL